MVIDKMTLEETIKLLEETSQKLENGELELEKSIELYEQGVKLANHARNLLDGFSKKITVLKKENGIIKEAVMEEKIND